MSYSLPAVWIDTDFSTWYLQPGQTQSNSTPLLSANWNPFAACVCEKASYTWQIPSYLRTYTTPSCLAPFLNGDVSRKVSSKLVTTQWAGTYFMNMHHVCQATINGLLHCVYIHIGPLTIAGLITFLCRSLLACELTCTVYMTISLRPYPSVFAYCKQSNTVGVNGLGARLKIRGYSSLTLPTHKIGGWALWKSTHVCSLHWCITD